MITMIKDNKAPKGNILETARIAGIMAAKKTEELIPLCHNIEIDQVRIDFEFEENGIRIKAMSKTIAKTGVEMEAMTAASIAALTTYDMVKMFNKGIEITDIYLLEKKGGKSGHWRKDSLN